MKQERVSHLAPALLGTIFLAAGASAQTAFRNHLGDKANDRLGHSARAAGDVNNDGKTDYVVGAPENGFVFGSGEGFARVYDGATGNTLYTFDGGAADDFTGAAVDGAGDVNNDGFADVIVGAPFAAAQNGRAYVYSGQTGALLYTVTGTTSMESLGLAVAGVGDVNGDGRADFAAASYAALGGGNQRGVTRVYSGVTGLLIGSINGAVDNDRSGVSIDGLGDLNGDGRSEIVIGSYFGGARVFSWNGSSFVSLYTFPATTSDDRFGISVANGGDVDGDLKNDILIGATQDGNFFSPGLGFVRIYSGATGLLIRTLTGGAVGDRFGYSVGSARDMDGDGRSEVIVGADQQPAAGTGYARVFKGSDGSVVGTVTGLVNNVRCGANVDGLGDLDGNGSFEVLVSSPERSVPQTFIGRIDLWSFTLSGCAAPFNFCAASVNSTGLAGAIGFSGTNSLAANNLTLNATHLPANAFCLFYVGQTAVQVPFGNGNRCIGGTVRRLPTVVANGSGTVNYTVDWNAPVFSGLVSVGATVKFQNWYRDPAAGGAAFNLTDGLSVTICN